VERTARKEEGRGAIKEDSNGGCIDLVVAIAQSGKQAI
jgi:hypothetical protein